ncbi:hypothetical protein Cni_G23132 [Canna indica]|uniref:DUF7950 domain-containing protein n=1 Tax=Canna indica TaxID=4628 RepID=A0AAQ3KSL3_9LILI|nr:hypothetical protein Cni_G23132 [Canna indica]
MDRRGGCCIAMYGGGGDAEAAWRMGRIMLRFRPIAPKPAVGSPAVAAAAEAATGGRRPKRKGSRNPGGRGRGRKPRKVEASSSPSKDDGKTSTSSSSSSTTTTTSSLTIVTLPLMPETPERKDDPADTPRESPGSHSHHSPAHVVPAWMARAEGEAPARAGVVVVAPRPVRAVGSWVTVECVTDTWREGEVAWRSDEAVRAALEADECPGFVSDEWGRVTWTNEAYRRMVAGSGDASSEGGAEEEEDVRVGLVARGLVPAAAACRAFTCRVRVRYARRPAKRHGSLSACASLAAPCDVWRLDDGGWGWRLDVKAALSLSL